MSDLNALAAEAAKLSPQKRAAAKRIPKTKKLSDRNFGFVFWRDQYWQKCRLSESSLATKCCIWVGVDAACMHLDQKQAADLAALLNFFAQEGHLP